MFIKIALVVLLCSLIVFFSEEITKLLKKIYALPLLTLSILMIVFTYLILTYEIFIYVYLLYLGNFLNLIIKLLNNLLGIQLPIFLCAFVFFMLLTTPILVYTKWKTKAKFEIWRYPHFKIFVLFIFFSSLFYSFS